MRAKSMTSALGSGAAHFSHDSASFWGGSWPSLRWHCVESPYQPNLVALLPQATPSGYVINWLAPEAINRIPAVMNVASCKLHLWSVHSLQLRMLQLAYRTIIACGWRHCRTL